MEWCERLLFDKEVVNVWTSHAITVAGLLGMLRWNQVVLVPALLIVMVGLGSAWFHADPTYRLMDEGPIFALTLWFLHCTVLHPVHPAIYAIGFWSMLFNPRSNCLVLIVMCLGTCRHTAVRLRNDGKALLGVGLVVWGGDLGWCTDTFPYLHSLWHCCVACAGYCALRDTVAFKASQTEP